VITLALYYAKTPLLVLAALYGIGKLFAWSCRRYPKTMRWVLIALNGPSPVCLADIDGGGDVRNRPHDQSAKQGSVG
jgi:hypothetical protein